MISARPPMAPERVAVGDRLAEGRQVGPHAANRLVAAQRVAEAGLHLVEDQHHAVAVAELAQALPGSRAAA